MGSLSPSVPGLAAAAIDVAARALRLSRRVLSGSSALRLRLLARREHAREARSPACLNRFEKRVYSQNGEDGILEEIFRRIGTTSRFCVEIGCGDGNECNSRRLIEIGGWSGILLEENPFDSRFAAARFRALPARVACVRMRPESIDAALEAHAVPSRIDLLSIDVDGNDYWLWERIRATRPRVVCIEYNASHLPWKSWVMPYDPDHVWTGGRSYGASLRALSALAKAKGYSLVGCDRKGVNAFFVEDALVADHFERPGDVAFHYRCPKYAWPWFGHARKGSGRLHLAEFIEHTGHPPFFRPNSIDVFIWSGVPSEYAAAPAQLSPEDTVIDIGCHIGSFSALAAMRGAGKVLAFEANRDNFEIASGNLSAFPQCEVRNVAVWRSDLPQREELLFVPASDAVNTGGGSVLFERVAASRRFGAYGRSATPGADGEAPHASTHPVTAVPLDEILREVPAVRCLKIDAEGSEFPILLTATLLDRVQEIVGEFHECSEAQAGLLRGSAAVEPGPFRIERLAAHLRERGFFVVWRRTGPAIGTFFACKGLSAASRVGRILAFYGFALRKPAARRRRAP